MLQALVTTGRSADPKNFCKRNTSVPDQYIQDRSSRLEVLCRKGVLKSFAEFTRKRLARVSFLIKLQA